MSRISAIATCPDRSVTLNVAQTLIQIVAATNVRATVKGWGIYGKGVVTTDSPILAQLIRQTGAGTSSANTPALKDTSVPEAVQTTARDTFTAEPASDDVIVKSVDVHPQSGFSEYFPLGGEIIVPGGGRLGVKATAAATVSMSAFIDFEE
jgi:hypothetical protein